MKIKNLVLSGLFIAVGILLPMAFHSIDAGKIFLPMHIAILLAGCFLPIEYAIFVAIAVPLASYLLTGMPLLFPNLCFIMPELIVYAVVINLLYNAFNWNINFALIGAMLVGRVASGLAVWFLIGVLSVNLPSPITFVFGSITAGIPGIAIQLLIIPAIVVALEKLKTRTKKRARA